MLRPGKVFLVLAVFTLTALSVLSASGQVEIFSSGMLTPETISLAPDGFGSFGGQYFIPDFARQSTNPADFKIWTVPHNGGAPSVFATNPGLPVSGLFLPNAGWGDLSGRYTVTGSDVKNYTNDPPHVHGLIYTYGADAVPHLLGSVDGATFTQPRIAPGSFGAFAGNLIVGDESNIATGVAGPGRLFAFDSSGVAKTISSTIPLVPFGLAFAPGGFGALSGRLFVSGGTTGAIDIVDADGTVTPFANIPLTPGHAGLRQLEFSPEGFIPGYGPLLFVSESGQDRGGGALGDLLALDSSGTVVASLRTDIGLAKFNPRGMFFLNSSQMLVSDSSDPILLVDSSAFRLAQAVPEPSAIALLLGCGVAAGLSILRRIRACPTFRITLSSTARRTS